jgi:hypothetical protein
MRNHSLGGYKFIFLVAVIAQGVVGELVSSEINAGRMLSGTLVEASRYTSIFFHIALIGTILAIINNLQKVSFDAYEDPIEDPIEDSDEDIEKSW